MEEEYLLTNNLISKVVYVRLFVRSRVKTVYKRNDKKDIRKGGIHIRGTQIDIFVLSIGFNFENMTCSSGRIR